MIIKTEKKGDLKLEGTGLKVLLVFVLVFVLVVSKSITAKV